MSWVVAIRTTRYPLILMHCCYVVMFLVKQGIPSDEDLGWLSEEVEKKWKAVGRRLGIQEARLTAFDNENREYFGKMYKMLLHWREKSGSAATYTVLHDALCHPLVNRTDLAEQFGANSNLPQFITGNISLVLQFNNTITYQYSA